MSLISIPGRSLSSGTRLNGQFAAQFVRAGASSQDAYRGTAFSSRGTVRGRPALGKVTFTETLGFALRRRLRHARVS